MNQSGKRNRASRAPFRIGTSGYLNLSGTPDHRSRSDLGLHDPARLRDSLQVTSLADAVFPGIVTGVRFWPFLLIARDLETNGKKPGAVRTLKKLKEIANKHKTDTRISSATRIGPKTLNSFRPYQSMYRTLLEKSEVKITQQLKPLADFFTDRRRKYRGDLEFFLVNKKAWRSALYKSLGKPGKDFARLIEQDDAIKTLWDAIEEILEKPKNFDLILVEAASAYALLVCLYGQMENGQIYGGGSRPLAKLLIKLIKKMPDLPVKRYANLLTLAAQSSQPPLAKIQLRARRENRRVLAMLRFGTFWNLYRRPCPNALERK